MGLVFWLAARMPWNTSAHQQRLEFVSRATQPHANFRNLCREFSISAPTGYKWLARFKASGAAGLCELSREPRRNPQKFRAVWQNEVIALRRKHPSWGVRKLRIHLKRSHPRARKLPALRTMGRWLKAAHLSAPRRPRSRPGPQLDRPKLTVPVLANDVWTIDFKGWFRTADGQRCDPLTIRDLASRYLLCITLVADLSDGCARKVMTPLFKRCGLPRVIRVDNGSPFAGNGALNLSRLSVWWMRLGIRVEFTRRAKPQDNGAHEQMHRVLKAETASPAAGNPRAQQRRLDRWREEYNTVRPHEALDYRFPADLYTSSPRRFHIAASPSYPDPWQSRRVRPNGWIKFRGTLRFIGRAFARQLVGLQPADAGNTATEEVWNVHLADLLIGTLHQSDGNGTMRQRMFRPPKKWSKKDQAKKPGVNHVVA
jgi:transposase InsO family protein